MLDLYLEGTIHESGIKLSRTTAYLHDGNRLTSFGDGFLRAKTPEGKLIKMPRDDGRIWLVNGIALPDPCVKP